jgi:hypothetical protein
MGIGVTERPIDRAATACNVLWSEWSALRGEARHVIFGQFRDCLGSWLSSTHYHEWAGSGNRIPGRGLPIPPNLGYLSAVPIADPKRPDRGQTGPRASEMESRMATTQGLGLDVLRLRQGSLLKLHSGLPLDRSAKNFRRFHYPAILAVLLTSAFSLTGCNRKQTKVAQPLKDPNALNTVVWARKMTGTYYCGDSYMYGKAGGEFMKQGTALDTGYQPDMGSYCSPKQAPPSIARPRADDAHAERHGIG